jgi:hypothetical protein
MKTLFLFAATAALGALAAPAAAQYAPQPYPQTPTPQPYPGQPGYGYPQQSYPNQAYPQTGYGYPQQQGGIAGVINQLLGNRYATNDRTAITQCATAASAQAARQYRPAYGQSPYGNAYGQGYGQQMAGQARVTAITNVERRNRGLRVTGLIDTGANGYNQPPYGNAYGYNQRVAAGDLSFRCNVDYNGQVTNIRLNRVRG